MVCAVVEDYKYLTQLVSMNGVLVHLLSPLVEVDSVPLNDDLSANISL